MPAETATPPVEAQAPATPEPQKTDATTVAEPAKPSGKHSLFEPFESEKKADKEPEKAEPEVKDKAAKAKPAPKATDKKADAPETPKESVGIKQLREGHEKATKEWQTKESDYQKRISDYEKQINELKGRPERHPDDQKRLTEYEQKLAIADFKRSDEFRKNFHEPLQKAYKDSLTLATKFPVITKNEDGDEQKRESTEADFRAVLQASPDRQAEIAHNLFGPVNAVRVISMVDRIADLYQRGEEEAARRAEQYESTRSESIKNEERRYREFAETLQKNRQEIESKMPEIFGDHKDDPDALSQLEAGRKYIEEFRSGMGNMSDAEIAERQAVMESAASAFPVMRYQLQTKDEKIASLEEELSKYRESDPGSAGKKSPPSPEGSDEPKGLGGLKSEWEKFDKH